MEKKSPTLKDVGALAGVTAATASMALRKNPRISKKTQTRVLAAAQKLNYRPDPLLSALVARREGIHVQRGAANLALLVDARWLIKGEVPPWMGKFLEGVRRMSSTLGYHTEVFFYPRDIKLGSSADRIFYTRGIQGVILFPLPGEAEELVLDWDQYALVVIGHPRLPQMPHRAGSDPFAAISLTCQELRKKGYQRVGLAHPLHQEKELRFEFLGSILKENFLPPKNFKVVAPYLSEDFNKKGLLTWIEKQRPQCIITVEESVLVWLQEAGYQIPQDIGIAFLNTHIIQTPDVAGTFLHNDITGENAIELLHSLLLRGARGFPDIVKEMLTYPHWKDGWTI